MQAREFGCHSDMKVKSRAVVYRLNHYTSCNGEFAHLSVDIARYKDYMPFKDGWASTCFTVEYQANAWNPTGWYSGHIKIESDCPSAVKRTSLLVQQVFFYRKKGEYGDHDTIEIQSRNAVALLERLKVMKAVRLVRDGRHGKDIPIEDVLPAEYRAYGPRYEMYGATSMPFTEVARSEDEAKALLKLRGIKDENFSFLDAWKNAGEPVFIPGYYEPPKAKALLSDEEIATLYEPKEEAAVIS